MASSREHRQQKALVRTLLVDGATEYEVCDELQVSPNKARRLIKEVLADEAAVVQGDTPAETYARHVITVAGMMRDLDGVIERGKGSDSHMGLNAVVAAVKAKHHIYSESIKLGQKLGVVREAPEEELTVDGRSIHTLPTDELRRAKEEREQDFEEAVSDYGEGDYLEDYDEEDLESLYEDYDEEAEGGEGEEEDSDFFFDDDESAVVRRRA